MNYEKRTVDSLKAELRKREAMVKKHRAKWHKMKGNVRGIQNNSSPKQRNTTAIKIFNMWAKNADKALTIHLDRIGEIKSRLKEVA